MQFANRKYIFLCHSADEWLLCVSSSASVYFENQIKTHPQKKIE